MAKELVRVGFVAPRGGDAVRCGTGGGSRDYCNRDLPGKQYRILRKGKAVIRD